MSAKVYTQQISGLDLALENTTAMIFVHREADPGLPW